MYHLPLSKVKEGLRVFVTSENLELIPCIIESVLTDTNGFVEVTFLREDTGEIMKRSYYEYSDMYTETLVD